MPLRRDIYGTFPMVRRIFLFTTLFLISAYSAWAQKQLVDRVVAVVNDEAVTQSEIDVFLHPLYDQLKEQYQGEELASQLNEIRLKLLNQIIEDRLVYQESKNRGITVDESEIDHMVEEAKTKLPPGTDFQTTLTSQGFSLSQLRENYRRQIAIRRLHDMEIRSQVVVSPQEIEDYYKNRQSEFAEEESLKIRSVTIRKNEEAIKKGLADDAAKQKIESIRKRILEGESFEKLARELSEDANAKEGGAAGWIKRGSMLSSIDQALFELKAGGISPVLETSVGYHVFKTEERKTSRIPPLEEVRDKIRGVIFQQKARKRFDEWMNQLKTQAYISIR